MKNIKYILMPILSLMFFASCEDAIDIKQPGQLYAENTFQTVDDLQKGVNACYVPFASGGIDTEISFASVFTDECSIAEPSNGGANTGQGLVGDATYLFTLNPTSGAPNAIWQSNYTLINYANRVISAAENITPSPDEQADYDNILAQARIFRAWGHFKLLSYFSPDMTNDSADGVILMNFVPKITDRLPRATTGEVYALIKEDLDFAETHLSGNLLTNPAPRVFLSDDFLTAFRARLSAYRGDYDTAFAYANTLKNNNDYPLTPYAQYRLIWNDNVSITDNEVIFKLERLASDASIGKNWAFNNSSVNGQPFYFMATDLYNSLNNIRDARRASFIGTGSNATMRCVGKYPTPAGTAWVNDVKIFRTSEMYFIIAEYHASRNDYANVQQTLQAINNARFQTPATTPTIPIPATAQAAWAEILKQRSIELCFEGHRYLDLKRLGAKASVNINRNANDCAKYQACGPVDAYKFTLPIPNIETRTNPLIEQNAGY